VGIEPATRRIFASASPANRWRSRPVLDTSGEVTGDNGTGLSAEAVEDTLTAPVIPLPSSIVSSQIHRDITVVRVRSALDSRGNPVVIPHAFSRVPATATKKAVGGAPARQRGRCRERPAATMRPRAMYRTREGAFPRACVARRLARLTCDVRAAEASAQNARLESKCD
jgi:hypothetical protein